MYITRPLSLTPASFGNQIQFHVNFLSVFFVLTRTNTRRFTVYYPCCRLLYVVLDQGPEAIPYHSFRKLSFLLTSSPVNLHKIVHSSPVNVLLDLGNRQCRRSIQNLL